MLAIPPHDWKTPPIRTPSLFAALTILLIDATLRPGVRAAAQAPTVRAPTGPESAASKSDGPSAESAAADLAVIKRRIQELTSRQARDVEQRDADAAALRATELKITARRRRIDELRTQAAAARRRRAELRLEAARLQSSLDAERAALAADLRNAYVMRNGGPGWIRGGRDAAGVGRMATYAGYFARRRAAAIDTIRGRAADIEALAGEIGRLTDRLRTLEGDAAREVAALSLSRDARAVSLAAIDNRLTSGAGDLKELRRQSQAEESLLADLARVVPDLPAERRRGFADLHGRLSWPVNGRIAGGAAPRWNGILIEAGRGAKIRAPCAGRVVYADWLQGLGLLLIVAHDGNFMTLYGHAEVLYKSVGDEVEAGEVIGALSDAGGAPPQLYFEIREGRSPQDPRAWLQPIR